VIAVVVGGHPSLRTQVGFTQKARVTRKLYSNLHKNGTEDFIFQQAAYLPDIVGEVIDRLS